MSLLTHTEVKPKQLMEIARNVSSRLSCGSKKAISDFKTVRDDDVIEPDIDVGSEDIVEVSENNSIKTLIEKRETKIPIFRGFLIEQLLGIQ